jgi:hypothetical protein
MNTQQNKPGEGWAKTDNKTLNIALW